MIIEVHPKEWGAVSDYDTAGPWYNPYHGTWNYPSVRADREFSIHWNGGPTKPGYWLGKTKKQLRAEEIAYIQGVDRFHLSKTPQHIAIDYNRLIGMSGDIYRGRNKWRNGAQYGNPNGYTEAVQFMMGVGQTPSLAAWRALGQLWVVRPKLMRVHRDYNYDGNPYNTSCPGDDIEAAIHSMSWVSDYLPVFGRRLMVRQRMVLALRTRLFELGYLPHDSRSPWYTRPLKVRVRRFQRDAGITTDGIVGPETYFALAAAPRKNKEAA